MYLSSLPRRALLVALLASPSLAFAQTVTVGPLGPLLSPASSTETYTIIDTHDPATSNGRLTTATFAWSASPCAAAAKIKIFRSRVVAPAATVLDFVDERGPFDVSASSPAAPGEPVLQTVSLDPPMPVLRGDAIAIARVGTCGAPVYTISSNLPPYIPTAVSRPGDVRTTVTGNLRDSMSAAVRATGPATAALDFGTTRALAVAPSDPSVVYAAGTAGVFASSDSGAIWTNRSVKADVLALAVDPSDPSTVWAGAGQLTSAGPGGLFRSMDGGSTWTPVLFAAIDWPVYAIAFEPGTPSTILVGTSVGLYRSADGGATWTFDTNGIPLTNIFTFAFAPSNPSVVYAGSAYGGGAHRSADTGLTWTTLPPAVPNQDVRAVAVDPTDANVMYRADYSVGVSKTTDGGQHWSLVLPVRRGVVALAVDPSAPGTVYAGASDFEYTGTGSCGGFEVGGLFRTTDGGATWNALSPANQTITALVIDPSHPTRLYAGTDLAAGNLQFCQGPRGVYQSEDAGATWRLAAQGQCSDDPFSLCLNAGRFRVSASRRTPDGEGLAHPIANTPDTGAFWFFSSNNVELVVKVVDGRAVNGHYWVFGGQLTDVEYTLTVIDTQTGAVWTHHNLAGTLASFADTSAFEP